MKLSNLNNFIMEIGIKLNLGSNYMEGYKIVQNMPIVELKKKLEYKN